MTELADKTITLAWGARRDERRWTNKTLTVETFADLFAEPQLGPKDGLCFLQGETVDPQRLNKNMRRNYLIAQDHDNGETTEDIIARIEATGLAAIVYNTHSHLATESEIPQDKLDRYSQKHGIDPNNFLKAACRYLRDVKGYTEALVESVSEVYLDHRAGGVKYVVEHDPMHKVRSIFFLDEPFEFAVPGVSQAARMDEWKARHKGFAEYTLGMTTDESTHDCARLMYAYRIPRDADPENYTSVLLPGRAVTLDDMLEWAAPKTRAQEANDLLADVVMATETGRHSSRAYQTPNLLRFLGDKRSKTFQAADWMARHTDIRTYRGEGKTEFECPHDALHTNAGDPNDKGFFAINADASLEPPHAWFMGCQHATCKTHTDGDRASYLDQACVNFGISDAMDLLEFCTDKEAKAEGATRLRAAGMTDIDGVINTFTARTPQSEIDATCVAIAASTDGIGVRAERTKNLATKLGIPIGEARRLVKDAERTTEVSEDNTPRMALPDPPRDPATATEVCDHWPYADQWACALALFLKKNEDNPTIFKTAGGVMVRLINDDDKKRAETIINGRVWKLEVKRRVPFVKVDPETGLREHLSAPPKEIVDDFEADAEINWPYLERVVDVPVFGADGHLLTTEGYDPGGRIYVKPTLECRPLPETILPEHVQEAVGWIEEAIVDFPFTDDFTGRDVEPIRDPSGATDKDGHPLPNYNRGRASRAHFYAMLLQPFARSLINGPCPAYLIDKSMPGTGAGFLADVLGAALYGARMAPQDIPEEQEAFRKEISTVLREGSPTIFFDNINHKMDSGALAAALTSGRWKARLLGTNDLIDVPVKATWIFATNQGSFTPELMRRIVPIRMDASVPNPARDRPNSFYKHTPLHDWLDAHRIDLVWACHVLIGVWVQEGMPPPDAGVTLQSFNHWSTVMGGILELGGIPGFLENVSDYLDQRVEETDTSEAFVRLIYDMMKTEPFTVEQAHEAAKSSNGRIDPGLGLNVNSRDETTERLSLGKVMGKLVGKHFNIHGTLYSWMRDGKLNNRWRYRICPHSEANTQN